MRASLKTLQCGFGLVTFAIGAAACSHQVVQGTGGSGTSTVSASGNSSNSVSSVSATGVTVSSAASTGASTSTSTSASSGQGGGTPTCTPADGAILAISHIYLGDKDPSGTASGTAWKQYGLEIDGVNMQTDFSMHCLPNSNASPQDAFLNGNGGIDNSFGHKIVPLLDAIVANYSDTLNASITAGDAGFFFDLVGLTASPNQTSIATRFYSGAKLGHPPAFDGSDCWPVDGATVTNIADIKSAKTMFSGGTLVNDLWTSGPPQTLALTLAVQGTTLTLTLHHAVVQTQLDPNHKGSALGAISGVLGTEEFVATVKQLAGTFSPTLCSGSTLDGIETQIRQASDIMVDGTQVPNVTCNGISVGLGFTTKPIQLGGVGPASPPPAMPCP